MIVFYSCEKRIQSTLIFRNYKNLTQCNIKTESKHKQTQAMTNFHLRISRTTFTSYCTLTLLNGDIQRRKRSKLAGKYFREVSQARIPRIHEKNSLHSP